MLLPFLSKNPSLSSCWWSPPHHFLIRSCLMKVVLCSKTWNFLYTSVYLLTVWKDKPRSLNWSLQKTLRSRSGTWYSLKTWLPKLGDWGKQRKILWKQQPQRHETIIQELCKGDSVLEEEPVGSEESDEKRAPENTVKGIGKKWKIESEKEAHTWNEISGDKDSWKSWVSVQLTNSETEHEINLDATVGEPWVGPHELV